MLNFTCAESNQFMYKNRNLLWIMLKTMAGIHSSCQLLSVFRHKQRTAGSTSAFAGYSMTSNLHLVSFQRSTNVPQNSSFTCIFWLIFTRYLKLDILWVKTDCRLVHHILQPKAWLCQHPSLHTRSCLSSVSMCYYCNFYLWHLQFAKKVLSASPVG